MYTKSLFPHRNLLHEQKKNRYIEILKEIRMKADYKAIPSIPGNKNRLGYFETLGLLII